MVYFFISLIFINLFIYYNNHIFLILLLASLYFLGRRVNVRLYIVCCVFIALFYTFYSNYFDIRTLPNYFKGEVEVIENYSNYSIVEKGNNRFLIYNGEHEFNEGNKIYFEGKLVDIRRTYNDFYNYLNKKCVGYMLDYNEFYIIDDSTSLNVYVVDKLLENKSTQSKSYLKLILFNVKDDYNKEFYSTFSVYSLTYLIAVSGFHVNLLLAFFKKIFRNNVLGVGVVCFYLYLLKFSISSYRAFLCYIFKIINKKLNFNISSLEIVSLIGVVLVACNPSIMFSLGFIFSFLSTLVLEIFRMYKRKNIVYTFYIYLINLPILLLNYYKLNLSSLFLGVILTWPISFLYIFSFLFLFLDKFYLLYEFIMFLFNKMFGVLSKLNFIVIMGEPSVCFVIFYYLLLVGYFICLERKRKTRLIYIALLFCMLFYQYHKPCFNSSERVYFLNVGQGDCSVFFIPSSKEVVLVDTGGNKYKDIAKQEIMPFLESKGISKIRKVIITHDDFDHTGALESLKKNFNVEEVVDTSLVEKIKIGNKDFKNLNASEYRDNEGSIVLYGEYAGYYLLLMGDASLDIEKKILKDIGQVDILKIGHHGSNTSSGYDFLKQANGKFAIISVGSNTYGHPHQEVIKRLNELGYIIFRTDRNNDIGFEKRRFNLAFIDYFD